MNTPEGQRAVLNVWAAGTDFEPDAGNQPKVEFARLAKVRGWVGGDADWCFHWHACFGEAYCYGDQHAKETVAKDMHGGVSTSTATLDLVDRTRRLSVDSDASSFSIVSAVLSVESLDSDGSIAGGVAVLQYTGTKGRDQQVAQSTAGVAFTPGKSSKKNNAKQKTKPRPAKPETSTPQGSQFWYQFPGFVPSPTATFKEEFARLAKQQGWGTKEKRKQQIIALKEEVAFHYGTCLQKLDRWQDLCHELGLENIPTTITKCKKALECVFVNLYNLIDHKRDPDVKIVHFKSYGQLARNIRAGNKFPRECAKQDGFIRVLLKKL